MTDERLPASSAASKLQNKTIRHAAKQDELRRNNPSLPVAASCEGSPSLSGLEDAEDFADLIRNAALFGEVANQQPQDVVSELMQVDKCISQPALLRRVRCSRL
jgi:hypothetical protein